MTFQVFLAEKAQRDLDAIPSKQADQILADFVAWRRIPSRMESASRNSKGLRKTYTD